MKKTLYEISTEALEIASALEYGELTEELEQSLVINKEELQHKAVNYAYVIKDSHETVTAIDEEIKRLQGLKEREKNKQERLKQAIEGAMGIYGIEKVETPTMRLSFRASESLDIINAAQIPKKWMKEKVTVSIDKAGIKKAIKEGEEVPGAIVVKNQNLQIK